MKIDLESMFAKYISEPKPTRTQTTIELGPLQQVIENVKTVFPGAKILSAEEIQKMDAKGYSDPSEWAESQTREPGEEG